MFAGHPGSPRLTTGRALCRNGLHSPVRSKSTLLRVLISGLLIGAAVPIIVWGLSETSPPARSAQHDQYVVVTVQPGDTLWSIARRVSEGKSDLRVLTHQIQKLNSLESAMILPGQSLTVPLDL